MHLNPLELSASTKLNQTMNKNALIRKCSGVSVAGFRFLMIIYVLYVALLNKVWPITWLEHYSWLGLMLIVSWIASECVYNYGRTHLVVGDLGLIQDGVTCILDASGLITFQSGSFVQSYQLSPKQYEDAVDETITLLSHRKLETSKIYLFCRDDFIALIQKETTT